MRGYTQSRQYHTIVENRVHLDLNKLYIFIIRDHIFKFTVEADSKAKSTPNLIEVFKLTIIILKRLKLTLY